MSFTLSRQLKDCQKADAVIVFEFVKDLGVEVLSLPSSEESLKINLESLAPYRVSYEALKNQEGKSQIVISLSTIVVDLAQRKRLLAYALTEGLKVAKEKLLKILAVNIDDNLLDEYRELDVIEVATKAIKTFIKKSDINVTLCIE